MDEKAANCDCMFCKNMHEFTISKDLLDELLSGKVTLFAGAGISTESRTVLKMTFYDSIALEIGKLFSSRNFSELMELYCNQPNGRLKLLNKIKDRFDHIDSFPELVKSATRFHRELGTFYPIKDIVTTNWDTYFEQFCKATPFVTDSDLAFWEAANRRVLKIHGSISNYGSIVATTEDYQLCHDRLSTGIIGSVLKTILATQTVIFIGYSLTDSDFLAIYDFVKKQMNSLHKQAYVVTPSAEDCERFKDIGLIPIKTDGAYFLSQIKEHAVVQGEMIPDDVFDSALEFHYKVFREHQQLHDSVKLEDCPEVIFATSYQDGLLHALERAISMKGSGKYSHRCDINRVINTYMNWQKEKRRRGVYEDVAYIEGYVNGLVFLLMSEQQRAENNPPLYFVFGAKFDIYDLDGFINQIQSYPKAHKRAHKRALSLLKHLAGDPMAIEFHHPPWL
ncbi:MAG: SIR2 family protein [Pseudomonadota bacterium]|nr:SIR2 family protein [Pseudomonadota bacterium]